MALLLCLHRLLRCCREGLCRCRLTLLRQARLLAAQVASVQWVALGHISNTYFRELPVALTRVPARSSVTKRIAVLINRVSLFENIRSLGYIPSCTRRIVDHCHCILKHRWHLLQLVDRKAVRFEQRKAREWCPQKLLLRNDERGSRLLMLSSTCTGPVRLMEKNGSRYSIT